MWGRPVRKQVSWQDQKKTNHFLKYFRNKELYYMLDGLCCIILYIHFSNASKVIPKTEVCLDVWNLGYQFGLFHSALLTWILDDRKSVLEVTLQPDWSLYADRQMHEEDIERKIQFSTRSCFLRDLDLEFWFSSKGLKFV